jgi:hypothetical protein
MRRFIFAIGLAITVLMSSGRVEAAELIIKDGSSHSRPQMLSFFLNVPWWYGVGIGAGARYAISIVPDGFIPKLNDSFELEFGADYIFRSSGPYQLHAVIIPFEVRWTFYFFDNFAAYAKVGVGAEINFGNNPLGNRAAVYHNILSPGVLFKLTDSLTLRGEISYWGTKVGLGISI